MLVVSLVTDLSLESLDLYSTSKIAAFYRASVCACGVCKVCVPVGPVHEHDYHPASFRVWFSNCINCVWMESGQCRIEDIYITHAQYTLLTYQPQPTPTHHIEHSVQYRALDTVATRALLAHANTSSCNSIQPHSTTLTRRTVAIYLWEQYYTIENRTKYCTEIVTQNHYARVNSPSRYAATRLMHDAGIRLF